MGKISTITLPYLWGPCSLSPSPSSQGQVLSLLSLHSLSKRSLHLHTLREGDLVSNYPEEQFADTLGG